VATAISLNLAAAAVQASSVSFEIFVPFDHNGVFHLVQMVALATLGLGLRLGTAPTPNLRAASQAGPQWFPVNG
jgi:hypothetical protein